MKLERLSVLGVAVCILAMAIPAAATTQSFAGFPAGTIVASPGPSAVFPLFTLTVINNAGPQAMLIFDSANPTGGDTDIGTPNMDFAGPGTGAGGGSGQPGENAVALGNLLIIAENVIDVAPADGIVDVPDCDADGGTFRFDFDVEVMVTGVTILDIDDETGQIDCYLNNVLVGSTAMLDLGDNSKQIVDVSSHGMLDRIDVIISSSGAVAEIEFEAIVPTEENTWGAIKAQYE